MLQEKKMLGNVLWKTSFFELELVGTCCTLLPKCHREEGFFFKVRLLKNLVVKKQIYKVDKFVFGFLAFG